MLELNPGVSDHETFVPGEPVGSSFCLASALSYRCVSD